MNNKKILFALFFTVFFTFGSSLLLVSRAESDETADVSITIDGVIEDGEWKDANYYNIPFYLNINDTGDDVDGYNYYSVAEDEDNLYFAFDLTSDRTNDESGEWFGLWLDTNETDFHNDDQWSEKLDNGTESFVYDVDNDREYPLFNENDKDMRYENVNNDGEITTTYGIQDGDTYDLVIADHSYNPNVFNLTSTDEWVSNDQSFLCNFSVDMNDWFPWANEYFFDQFLEQINSIDIEVISKLNETNIESFEFIIKEKGNDTSIWNPDNRFDLQKSSSYVANTIPYGLGNMTDDKIIDFVIYGKNESDNGVFQANIDRLRFEINVTDFSDPGYTDQIYAHTTMDDYNIEWSFGSSENCNESHRMFEIAIPKSGLELYDTDGKLGIFFGGYGTMSMDYTSYWYHCVGSEDLDPYKSRYYIYLDMEEEVAVPPEEQSLWDAFMENIALIITAIIGGIIGIFAFIGLGIIRKRKKRMELCGCDPREPECECDF